MKHKIKKDGVKNFIYLSCIDLSYCYDGEQSPYFKQYFTLRPMA